MDTLTDRFQNSRNPKEMWNSFRKLTNRSSENSVLPLRDSNNTIIFDQESKCSTLQKTFFDDINQMIPALTRTSKKRSTTQSKI